MLTAALPRRPYPSGNWSSFRCLTSVIVRELIFPSWHQPLTTKMHNIYNMCSLIPSWKMKFQYISACKEGTTWKGIVCHSIYKDPTIFFCYHTRYYGKKKNYLWFVRTLFAAKSTQHFFRTRHQKNSAGLCAQTFGGLKALSVANPAFHNSVRTWCEKNLFWGENWLELQCI